MSPSVKISFGIGIRPNSNGSRRGWSVIGSVGGESEVVGGEMSDSIGEWEECGGVEEKKGDL